MAREGLGPLPLAKRMGQPKLQPQIHRFVNGGVAAPRASTAAPLAAYFGLPLEAVYDENVATEEARARGISESGCDGAPAGPPTQPRQDHTEPGSDIRGRVPLISWFQAGTWAKTCDVLQLDQVERWLECPVPHSPCTAALRVRGDSMTAPLGAVRSYPEGCFIFVDFEHRTPVNSQRVVARLNSSGDATFKVYKNEDGRRWLLPLNPLHPPVFEPFEVLGTVIGTWLDE